jgi:hypothetical protein
VDPDLGWMQWQRKTIPSLPLLGIKPSSCSLQPRNYNDYATLAPLKYKRSANTAEIKYYLSLDL